MITRFKKTSAKYTAAALMITLFVTGCSGFTTSTSTSNATNQASTANMQTQTDIATAATVPSTSNVQIAETVATKSMAEAQPDIKDTIIYIADISNSLRGIVRYSFTENGEIVTGSWSSFGFDANCRYFKADQTEINFQEFATIASKKYSLGTYVKCNIKGVGRLVKEAYLLD